MGIKLLVAGGKSAGRVVPVTVPKFFIGRAPDCHLRPGSHLVSRHHCVILIKKGGVAVRDFGSTNGTLVNGERIRGEQELKDGDRLTVGPLEFEVRLAADTCSRKPPGLETVAVAPAPTTSSSTDDELDISQWLGDIGVPAAPKSLAETKKTEAAGRESGVGGRAAADATKPSKDQPVRDVSEEYKDEIRRRREIPGVSKAAQARRVTETPQDAASAALKRFYR
jgi:pSer/pThr/pTyr-binding forkhead associated (FHA) protein